MKQVTLSVDEARACGVTHIITSRSFPRWADTLRTTLNDLGVPDHCIDAGRAAVHVQFDGVSEYLLKFSEPDDSYQRDAAQRVAAAAVAEEQNRVMSKKPAGKRSRANA